jgi:sigma-B regulation protein RsbU (phosphoserine phosphatase)
VRDLTLLLRSYDGEQSTLALDHFPFTVGKSTDCDLVFSSLAVSRHHATLTREGDDVYIVDERSMRGTFVNGELIDRCKLKRGDKIEFGLRGVEWVRFDPGCLA